MSEYLEKRNLTTIGIVILVLVVLIWFFCPTRRNEGFGEDNAVLSGIAKGPSGPSIDAVTGTTVDGPGFEQSNISGSDEVALPGKVPSNFYFLDDGANGEMSLTNNLFSKSCCSNSQWPTPFMQKADPYVCGHAGEFVPSNYFGNNTFQDVGCACVSKQQGSFIGNRGGNGRDWF